MPKEDQGSPSCPRTLLLSKSEPSLLITSPALLNLRHVNPSCPQACSRNSTNLNSNRCHPEHSSQPRCLVWAKQSNSLCCYPVVHCQVQLRCLRRWDAGSSMRWQAMGPLFCLCLASSGVCDICDTRAQLPSEILCLFTKTIGVCTRISGKYSATATGWGAVRAV